MPHLYPHKTKGWRVIYRVYFLDGTHFDKTRWSQSKENAAQIYSDVNKLETLTRVRQITKQEITYCVNRGYISESEAAGISAGHFSVFTWCELARKYEDWSRENCRESTHRANYSKLKMVLDYIEEHWQGRSPADIVRADIDGYISARKKQGIKNATIRKEHTILRKLLDNAGADNPARLVRAPVVNDERLPVALAFDELVAFMRELRRRRRFLHGYLWPVTMIYLYAGMRPSEIIKLTAKDIRSGKILIHGATKTGHYRSIEIHPKLMVYVDSCLRRGGKRLCGGDTPLLSPSISRAIRHILREIGVEGATPYSLRHTFVTNLLRSSGDLRYVMDRAGHKRLATTTRYLHIIPSKISPLKKMKFGS